MASDLFSTTTTRILSPSNSSRPPALERTRTSFLPRASLSANLVSPYVGGSITGEFSGRRIRTASLTPLYSSPSSSRPKRRAVDSSPRENAEEYAPDLISHFFQNRIIYFDMVLIPEVVESLIRKMFYLARKDNEKPIYLYINSTGTIKDYKKYGLEHEALSITDHMSCLGAPFYTLCVGHAWGEAALILTAGKKGHRAALPSASIMIREPMDIYQGQASVLELSRRELNILKQALVKIYAEQTGKTKEQIETDIRRPKYFNATEAVEYGLIDKVLASGRAKEVGDVAKLKYENPFG